MLFSSCNAAIILVNTLIGFGHCTNRIGPNAESLLGSGTHSNIAKVLANAVVIEGTYWQSSPRYPKLKMIII